MVSLIVKKLNSKCQNTLNIKLVLTNKGVQLRLGNITCVFIKGMMNCTEYYFCFEVA